MTTNPFNPVSPTQFQGWASFYGGNVQAPNPPPPSAFGAAALGQTPPSGQYTGGWSYPDAWANFYEGKQGFQTPQNQNTPAGALAASNYARNVNNPNDPNFLGWEQAYGNPNTILANDQNWAQSLGPAPTSTPSGNLTGGWQNPEAWAAYYGGTNGFTAPANAGSPASALAAAAQIAQTSNPQDNPALLGWVQDYGQPGSVLANTPNWAASLGTPQVDANGTDIGQTNTQGWTSPLAWASYYGGFQGFQNPVDNTLQAAQNFAGVANPNDPSLLGWELDYGNPQTVVTAIQASPGYQQYQTALAQYQQLQTQIQASYNTALAYYNEYTQDINSTENTLNGLNNQLAYLSAQTQTPDVQNAIAALNTDISNTNQLLANYRNSAAGYYSQLSPNTAIAFEDTTAFTNQEQQQQVLFQQEQANEAKQPVAPVSAPAGSNPFSSALFGTGNAYVGAFQGAAPTSTLNLTYGPTASSEFVSSPTTVQGQGSAQTSGGFTVNTKTGPEVIQTGAGLPTVQFYQAGLNAQAQLEAIKQAASRSPKGPSSSPSGVGEAGGVGGQPTPYLGAGYYNLGYDYPQLASEYAQIFTNPSLSNSYSQYALGIAGGSNQSGINPGVTIDQVANTIPTWSFSDSLGGGLAADMAQQGLDPNFSAVPYTPPIDFENPSGTDLTSPSEDFTRSDLGGQAPLAPPNPFGNFDFSSIAQAVSDAFGNLTQGWTAPPPEAPGAAANFPGVDLSAPPNVPLATDIAVSPGTPNAQIPGAVSTTEVSPGAFDLPPLQPSGNATTVGPYVLPDVAFNPENPSYAPPLDVFTDPGFGANTLYQGGYGQPVQDQLPPPQPFSNAEQFVEKYGTQTTLRQVLNDATPAMLQGNSLSTVLWALGSGVDTPIDLTNPNFLSQIKSAIDAGGGWGGDQVVSGLQKAMTGGPQAIVDAAQDKQQDVQEGPGAYGQLGYNTVPTYGTPQPNLAPPMPTPQAATPNPVPPLGIPGITEPDLTLPSQAIPIGETGPGSRLESGTVTIGEDGTQYPFLSGGMHASSGIPPGSYNIDFSGVGPQGLSGWGGQTSPAIAGVTTNDSGNNIAGPYLSAQGIEIHSLWGPPGSPTASGTLGCFGITEANWPAFSQSLQSYAAQSGPIVLTISPGENGTFTAIIQPASGGPTTSGVNPNVSIDQIAQQGPQTWSFPADTGVQPGYNYPSGALSGPDALTQANYNYPAGSFGEVPYPDLLPPPEAPPYNVGQGFGGGSPEEMALSTPTQPSFANIPAPQPMWSDTQEAQQQATDNTMINTVLSRGLNFSYPQITQTIADALRPYLAPSGLEGAGAFGGPPTGYNLGQGFGGGSPDELSQPVSMPSISGVDFENPSGQAAIQAGYSYLPGSFGEVDPYNFSSAPVPAGAFGGGGFPDQGSIGTSYDVSQGFGGGSPTEMLAGQPYVAGPEFAAGAAPPTPNVQYGQPVSEPEAPSGVSPQALPGAPGESAVPTTPIQGEGGVPNAPSDVWAAAYGADWGAPASDLTSTMWANSLFPAEDYEQPYADTNVLFGRGALQPGQYIDYSSLLSQINDPQIQKWLMWMAGGEVGSRAQDVTKEAIIQTALNRALERNQDVSWVLQQVRGGATGAGQPPSGGGGYYAVNPPTYSASASPTQAQMDYFQSTLLPAILSGQNYAAVPAPGGGYTIATGNASANVAANQYAQGTPGARIPGGTEDIFLEKPYGGLPIYTPSWYSNPMPLINGP